VVSGLCVVCFLFFVFIFLLSMIVFKDFSLISWNVRGFASKKSKTHMRELLKRFKPDLLFIFETHTPFASSKKFWDKEGFDCLAVEEAQGHSGGVWVVVNHTSRFTYDVVDTMPQCISVKISFGAHSWVCTGAYASPNYTTRCLFWDYLVDLRTRINQPWALIGDLNEILLPSEQRGGVFSQTRASRFGNMLDRCGFMDLNYFGSKFTWNRQCVGGRSLSKRLDRGVCDHEWRMSFQEATVEHLVRRHSDHNPLLLRCNQVSNRGHRPFRFQAAWCTHTSYSNVVLNAWNKGNGSVVASLQSVEKDSLTFNEEHFGNIFRRKKHLESRMRGIQRVLEEVDSARLLLLHKDLLQEYEGVLFQEETLWFQKSRENWIKLGSRNTSFFHAQTVVRRKRNKIHGLHIAPGSWCTDPDILRNEALKYFKCLFGTLDELRTDQSGGHHNALTHDDKRTLTQAVTKEEVYQALMSMKSYKAPGPDGFQPIFFKMFWKDVGNDVWNLVRQAFASGTFDPSITETMVVLIQKGDNPSSFKDFRPISLCNVVYKLISKVLVNRLRPILSRIVSPLQSSFIPGRSTKDNAIVLQEMIHHLRKKKSKKGDLILKLDLEKAYDRLDWRFLRQTLNCFAFPEPIISLIMHGISSSSISLLWNGSRTESFTPKRGLRQGDPLSPYLFVLCMERLGGMITNEVNANRWMPIQLSRNGPSFSHLFFADDVLLFGKAKVSQARQISKVLENFCAFSGLKVSLEKSVIFASAGVTNAKRIRLLVSPI
jgi:hypothetical protein